jgi:hypothetical protein
MLPAMFRLIWPSGFRGGDLKKLANHKQELPVEGQMKGERHSFQLT